MNGSNPEQIDFNFDKNSLRLEESVTDLKVGAIRCLKPINPDGSEDKSRQTLFMGHTQLHSPQGLVPLQAPLQAKTLEEAMEEFPGAMKKALEEMVQRAQQMQAQQQAEKKENDARIIMPGK